MNVRERLDAGRATTEDAIELFDSLEPVDVDFMIGDWKGEGFHTNHPMDGLLEAYHWHGKRFGCGTAFSFASLAPHPKR